MIKTTKKKYSELQRNVIKNTEKFYSLKFLAWAFQLMFIGFAMCE